MRGFIVVGVLCGLISTVGAAPKKKLTPSPRAVVIVIDKSGSMQGPRLEAARTATMTAITGLKATDFIAVVGFDSEATVLVAPTLVKNKTAIKAGVDKLLAGGGTNIFPGLKEAHTLMADIKASKKHVILLSDGQAPSDGIVDLVNDMRVANITVSAFGVGEADRTLLTQIVDAGAGRLHMIDDLAKLPNEFLADVVESQH